MSLKTSGWCGLPEGQYLSLIPSQMFTCLPAQSQSDLSCDNTRPMEGPKESILAGKGHSRPLSLGSRENRNPEKGLGRPTTVPFKTRIPSYAVRQGCRPPMTTLVLGSDPPNFLEHLPQYTEHSGKMDPREIPSTHHCHCSLGICNPVRERQ